MLVAVCKCRVYCLSTIRGWKQPWKVSCSEWVLLVWRLKIAFFGVVNGGVVSGGLYHAEIESQQRDNDSLQRLGIDRLDEMEKVFLRGFPFPPAASFRSTV